MTGTILFRMILWELGKVFLMSLVGITGILLMAGIIAEASQQGLGPRQVLAAIPLLIPSTLPYTIPATTLFASCVVYGRLSADNEVMAIKACGVNVLHVVKPGLILGLLMSLATLSLYYQVIPFTHRLLRQMVAHDIEELLYTMLRRDRMISNNALPYAMFITGLEGKKLIGPVFKRKNPKGEIDVVAHAREAELQVDLNHTPPVLVIKMKIGVARGEDGNQVFFDYRDFDAVLPENFGKEPNTRARDMTWPELQDGRTTHRKAQQSLAGRVAALTAQMLANNAPVNLAYQVRLLKEKLKQDRHEERLLYVEMLMRPALSFGCLCFILVGCPIGIMFSRGDYLGAFITCFLPITIVYYPLVLCGTNMAKEGRFNEIPLVFGADAVIALAGLWLLRVLLRN
jgi:lipopolysaccharide export system permease protein